MLQCRKYSLCTLHLVKHEYSLEIDSCISNEVNSDVTKKLTSSIAISDRVG
jgi:hypothetical protein